MVWYNYNGVLSKSKWRLFNQSGILSVSRDSYVWFYEYFNAFLLSYGWSKKRFSYLHSTVNRTFDIDFRSIIIVKLRCKNNISSPAGASQQERDKDHFSVSSSNKITLDNSLCDYSIVWTFAVRVRLLQDGTSSPFSRCGMRDLGPSASSGFLTT